MVTPTTTVVTLKGVSGREYSFSGYISDVVGGAVLIDLNKTATSATPSNFYITPERCYLKDISTITGPTVATALVVQVNDVNVGVIALANTINTLPNRSIPTLAFEGGRKFAIVQA